MTRHGADHDDLTVSDFVLDHGVDTELGAETGREDIDIQHGPPRLHGSVEEVLRCAHPSIVDTHVHPAQVGVG